LTLSDMGSRSRSREGGRSMKVKDEGGSFSYPGRLNYTEISPETCVTASHADPFTSSYTRVHAAYSSDIRFANMCSVMMAFVETADHDITPELGKLLQLVSFTRSSSAYCFSKQNSTIWDVLQMNLGLPWKSLVHERRTAFVPRIECEPRQ
jgi:hypothetical protein